MAQKKNSSDLKRVFSTVLSSATQSWRKNTSKDWREEYLDGYTGLGIMSTLARHEKKQESTSIMRRIINHYWNQPRTDIRC